MKRITILFAVLAVFLWVGSAAAFTINDIVSGVNITTYDGESDGTSSGWYSKNEDQEVELGMQTGQRWDLEAFFWNKDTSYLYLVAGFDFATETLGYAAGDVFLRDVNGTDYVLDLDRSSGVDSALNISSNSGSYTAYKDNGNGIETVGVHYSQNYIPSDPYAHNSTNNDDTSLGVNTYSYYNSLNDGAGIVGDNGSASHYILAFNLSWLLPQQLSSAHFTLECGNDDIEGSAPVPEPATMLLFGVGLCGLAFVGRKKLIKQG